VTSTEIIQKLPYQAPFLFVDEILEINEEGVKGCYTLRPDAYFYKGHFIDHPVTPGVILTEIMAQIGLVSLGVFICKNENDLDQMKIGMTNTTIDFYKPVFPGEKLMVEAKKLYFRFHKLKCDVKLYNTENILVAKGSIAGMITNAYE